MAEQYSVKKVTHHANNVLLMSAINMEHDP